MVRTSITRGPHSPEQAAWRKWERWQFWRPEFNPGSAPKQLDHLGCVIAQPRPQVPNLSTRNRNPALTWRCAGTGAWPRVDLPSNAPALKHSDKPQSGSVLPGVGAAGMRGPQTIRPHTQCKPCAGPMDNRRRREGLLFLLVDSSLQVFGLSANNNSSGTLYNSTLENLLGDRSPTGRD